MKGAANCRDGDGRGAESVGRRVRTPLIVAAGMMEWFQEAEITEEQRRLAQRIQEDARLLLATLADEGVADGVRLPHARTDVSKLGPSTFGLREALERMGRFLSGTAAERGVSFRCSVAPDLPDRFTGDWLRLSRILISLVGNAIEATGEGCVSLQVSLVERSGPEITLRFSVSDTGPGIPADRLTTLIQELDGRNDPDGGRWQGSGRGLAMASRQAEAVGGHLFIQSRSGEGSTFHFTVVLRTAEVPQAQSEVGWLPAERK